MALFRCGIKRLPNKLVRKELIRVTQLYKNVYDITGYLLIFTVLFA